VVSPQHSHRLGSRIRAGSFSIAAGYGVTVGVRFSINDFFFCSQTGTHPASYALGTGFSVSGVKVSGA
jgi:hypothetical protein